jgi:SAM-dependent methyltransferase
VDPRLERSLLEAEEEHYWFRARRRIIGDVIRALPLPAGPQLLDVGCGGGRFLLDLAEIGDVAAVEPLPASFSVARSRGVGRVLEADIHSLPFETESFDVVTCLDVIEHVKDDVGGFAAMRRVTRPAGHLVVTVPAYQWLWSDHDRLNHHFRRYNRRTLVRAAVAGGWRPLRWTYFNALLLLPATLYRLVQATPLGRRFAEERVLVETPPLVNRLLEQPLNVEARLLRAGVRIPAGLSLLGVFRRDGDA